MSYKPKFCCQCGEKVDRTDWKIWTSRRFCELCETDFKLNEWLPRAVVGIALLFGLLEIGLYFQKPESQLETAPRRLAASNTKSEAVVPPPRAAQVLPDKTVQTPVTAPIAPPVEALKTAPPRPIVAETAEKVYFCGATTKKGTMCSRRVRNGGRCWQHEGQTAMLPQEKLLAVR